MIHTQGVVNNMKKSKEFLFDVVTKRHTRCIHIKVEDGEIVYAAECYSRTRKDIIKNPNPHDLSKNSPNWERLKKYMIWCWDANRKEFSKLFVRLNMNSQAYKYAKNVLEKRYYELTEEIEDIKYIIPRF